MERAHAVEPDELSDLSELESVASTSDADGACTMGGYNLPLEILQAIADEIVFNPPAYLVTSERRRLAAIHNKGWLRATTTFDWLDDWDYDLLIFRLECLADNMTALFNFGEADATFQEVRQHTLATMGEVQIGTTNQFETIQTLSARRLRHLSLRKSPRFEPPLRRAFRRLLAHSLGLTSIAIDYSLVGALPQILKLLPRGPAQIQELDWSSMGEPSQWYRTEQPAFAICALLPLCTDLRVLRVTTQDAAIGLLPAIWKLEKLHDLDITTEDLGELVEAIPRYKEERGDFRPPLRRLALTMAVLGDTTLWLDGALLLSSLARTTLEFLACQGLFPHFFPHYVPDVQVGDRTEKVSFPKLAFFFLGGEHGQTTGLAGHDMLSPVLELMPNLEVFVTRRWLHVDKEEEFQEVGEMFDRLKSLKEVDASCAVKGPTAVMERAAYAMSSRKTWKADWKLFYYLSAPEDDRALPRPW